MNQALLVSNLVLWVLVLALAAVVAALARRIAQLHAHTRPVSRPTLAPVPTIGDTVAPFAVRTLDGTWRTIGGPHAAGHSTLVFFLADERTAGRELLSTLEAVHQRERDWLDLVLADAGTDATGEQHRFMMATGLVKIPRVQAADLAPVFQVPRLPAAAFLDAGGVLRSLDPVDSAADLEGLLQRPAN